MCDDLGRLVSVHARACQLYRPPEKARRFGPRRTGRPRSGYAALAHLLRSRAATASDPRAHRARPGKIGLAARAKDTGGGDLGRTALGGRRREEKKNTRPRRRRQGRACSLWLCVCVRVCAAAALGPRAVLAHLALRLRDKARPQEHRRALTATLRRGILGQPSDDDEETWVYGSRPSTSASASFSLPLLPFLFLALSRLFIRACGRPTCC